MPQRLRRRWPSAHPNLHTFYFAKKPDNMSDVTTAKEDKQTTVLNILMECLNQLEERDHFYQYPLSYSYE